MEKKNGFILYFDILGYRNVLKNGTQEEIARFYDILQQFSSFYSKANMSFGFGQKYDEDQVLYRSFSDNFLYLYQSDRKEYSTLAILESVASRIQYQFLCVGILTRGSITYGEISYDDNIVFGRALVRAVELEEGHREPSIVIDENLRDVYEGINGLSYKKEVSPFDVWPDSVLDYQDCLEGIRKYLHSLENIDADPNILSKIAWVIDRVNEYFDEAKKHPISLHQEQGHFSIKGTD